MNPSNWQKIFNSFAPDHHAVFKENLQRPDLGTVQWINCVQGGRLSFRYGLKQRGQRDETFSVCSLFQLSMFSLKSRLSFCSLNARGLKNKVKRKGIFLFCKGQKSHFVFLQETHSTEEYAAFWKMQWGDTVFSHGSSRSAGVAICLNNCPGKVVTFQSDAHGHWLSAVVNCEGILIFSLVFMAITVVGKIRLY